MGAPRGPYRALGISVAAHRGIGGQKCPDGQGPTGVDERAEKATGCVGSDRMRQRPPMALPRYAPVRCPHRRP